MSRIWKFGSDVDTDQIVPGRYAPYMRPDEDVGSAVFIESHPEFNKQAKSGDVIVADTNFGCGSSREYAPLALRRRGISAIVARSYARIFFRNALNLGIPVFTSTTLIDRCIDGQSVLIDVEKAQLTIDGELNQLDLLAPFALQVIKAGGITAFVRQTGQFPDGVGC